MSKNQAGKGDKPRPIKKELFDNNYEQIVWKKNLEQQTAISKRGKKTFKY
jgi:hypothetical protein